jgi:hypothetical protein
MSQRRTPPKKGRAAENLSKVSSAFQDLEKEDPAKKAAEEEEEEEDLLSKPKRKSFSFNPFPNFKLKVPGYIKWPLQITLILIVIIFCFRAIKLVTGIGSTQSETVEEVQRPVPEARPAPGPSQPASKVPQNVPSNPVHEMNYAIVDGRVVNETSVSFEELGPKKFEMVDAKGASLIVEDVPIMRNRHGEIIGIQIGQTVYVENEDVADQLTGGSKPPYPQKAPEKIVYVVQRNDNLQEIAQRFGTTVSSIHQLNPQLRGGSVLWVGDRLTIYSHAE